MGECLKPASRGAIFSSSSRRHGGDGGELFLRDCVWVINSMGKFCESVHPKTLPCKHGCALKLTVIAENQLLASPYDIFCILFNSATFRISCSIFRSSVDPSRRRQSDFSFELANFLFSLPLCVTASPFEIQLDLCKSHDTRYQCSPVLPGNGWLAGWQITHEHRGIYLLNEFRIRLIYHTWRVPVRTYVCI